MIKIIIIFIIVICLLSFMEVSCLAKDVFNYAELWNSLSSYEKEILILGVGSGIEKCVNDYADWCSSFVTVKDKESKGEEDIKREVAIHILEYEVEYLRIFLWKDSNPAAQIRITSELYEDPANACISIADMYFLALRKLIGESIELSLKELREKALL